MNMAGGESCCDQVLFIVICEYDLEHGLVLALVLKFVFSIKV